MAMEMTAAGMEVENVNPAFKPKNTFAAVKINVIRTPRIIPRSVNSLCCTAVAIVVVAIMDTPDSYAVSVRCWRKSGADIRRVTYGVPRSSHGACRQPAVVVVEDQQ